MQKRFHVAGSLALLGLAFAAPVLHAPRAQACGGLFCSTSPVDQNAERILFRVHGDGTVTAVVEITYSGDPESFSWIVPVPETPSQMDVAPASSLRLLDLATAPRIIPPPTTCSDFARNMGAFPPGAQLDPAAGNAESDDGVVVEDLPAVGPYDPEVVSSDDPNALIQWLEDNDYLITDEMKPFIAEYSDAGYKFLGVKLLPDAGISDISPLSFTCPVADGAPHIPLKLTAVASEPEMGVLAFVAGPQRFAPVNFREMTVNTDLVQFNPRTQESNYYPLVSWLVDEEGGKAFITELAGSSQSLRDDVDQVFLPTADFEDSLAYVRGVLDEHAYITRLYTRMSGWEMDDDPAFSPTASGDVSNVHDLSGRPAVEVCGSIPFDSVPCGNTYCGVGSRCAVTAEGQAGCVCDEGTVARAITAPRGRGLPLGQSVTCQDTALDMLQSVVGQIADPCGGFSCGEAGQCLPVNGFATCRCNDGFVAVNDFGRTNGLDCRPAQEVFSPEQLLWPNGVPGTQACACATPGDGLVPSGLFGLALLSTVALFGRRRRG